MLSSHLVVLDTDGYDLHVLVPLKKITAVNPKRKNKHQKYYSPCNTYYMYNLGSELSHY